jgi:hypothetical protein
MTLRKPRFGQDCSPGDDANEEIVVSISLCSMILIIIFVS